MMKAEIWNKVVAALAPERGGPYLDRVMNLHGALDFRGPEGAEAWALAMGSGNWIAAAIIARHGYEPPGDEALARYLSRHRLDASDLNGRPAAYRLWGLLHTSSSCDDAGALTFLLKMGKPWRSSHLNAGLFLAAKSKKGAEQIRLLCEAGGQIDCRLEEVQTELLAEAGLARGDLNGLSQNEREEFLTLAGMGESGHLIALWEHEGATPLIVAAASFSGGRLAPWVECGADVAAADATGQTALHWCCRGRNAASVSALLATDREGVNRRDHRGVRPMDVAMRRSDGRVLALLLEAGAEMPEAEADVSSHQAGALLRLAVRAGVSLPQTAGGAAKLLATMPAMEGGLDNSLCSAAERSFSELVELLLTAGASPRYVDPAQRTGLQLAAENGDARSVALLVAAGAAVELRNLNGDTPLLLACRAGDGEGQMTEALLAGGADPKATDGQGGTCLHALAGSSSPGLGTVRALVAAGAKVDALDRSGTAALHAALRRNHLGLVRALLEAGADPNLLYEKAFTPLGLCLTVEALELLLAAKASLDEGKSGVAMAVLRQAAYGTEAVFAAVLQALQRPGAVRSQRGETMLHQVAWSDRSEDAVRVATVIGRCPEVDELDNEGQTPLMGAAKYGSERAVERLLAAGAVASRCDTSGRSAADHAVGAGRWKLAEFLAGQ